MAIGTSKHQVDRHAHYHRNPYPVSESPLYHSHVLATPISMTVRRALSDAMAIREDAEI